LKQLTETRRFIMSHTSARISDIANGGTEALRETYGSARESIHDAGDAVRAAARETAREAVKAGRAQAGRAADVAQDAAHSVSSYIRARPVEAALIGLGGLVIASLLLRRR
jgi:ElaB/YqjD/DUF883 family membrane-anchored ribosome-binding protein